MELHAATPDRDENPPPMGEVRFHPLANLFPLLEGAAFDGLVDDIRINGQRDDIVIFEAMVLDGRNRYRACLVVGAVPICRDYGSRRADGSDPQAFVLSQNLRRRNLNESQVAMVAADLGRMRQGTRTDLSPAGEKSQRERAELVGVGKRSVERADIIVARGVPQLAAAVRAGRLTVSIAEKIAKLPAEQQRGVVGESDAGELSRRARAALAKYRRDCRIEQIASGTANLPDKKYAVIYCDIPRRFNAWSAETGLERSPDNHYPTMTFDELLRIPVRDLAAEDCVLFFWSTSASLLDDLEIIAEWGFAPLRPRDEFGRLRCDAQGSSLQPVGEGSYRSHQVWVKDRVGTGYWFRNQHELLLVCVRGDVPAPLFGSQDASIVTAPVTKHSEKPLRFRGMIDRHYPNVPKIELFCRGEPAPGWVAFGNEARAPESMSDSTLSRALASPHPFAAVQIAPSQVAETAASVGSCE